jgi:hypothetical protein
VQAGATSLRQTNGSMSPNNPKTLEWFAHGDKRRMTATKKKEKEMSREIEKFKYIIKNLIFLSCLDLLVSALVF